MAVPRARDAHQMAENDTIKDLSVHALILKKAQADRPLPAELCDAYARRMVDRINRRQACNNVPILLH